MERMNAMLAVCIVLFGLGFVYVPTTAFLLMRMFAAMMVAGLLLVPAGVFWFNWMNKTN